MFYTKGGTTVAYFRKVPAKNAKGYTWSVTVDLGRDPITGKRRQTTRRGFATKKEAEKAASELIAQAEKGVNIINQNISLEEYLKDWIELSAKRKVKETTLKNYIRAINHRIIPALGKIPLRKLTAAQCQQFINALIDEGLSERYIEYIYTVLYGALQKAIEWDLILVNPLIKVDVPRGRKRKYMTWTREELNRFLSFAKLENIIYYTAFLTAAHTGMRRGELLGLKWQDIDFEHARIHIQRNLIYDEDGFRFGDLKTEASQRIIAMDDFLLKELKRYKAKQAEIKLIVGNQYEDNGLVFARETGKPIFPRTLTDIFNRVIKAAGVKKIRFHDLRHTHATLLLEAGADLKEVQARLGHASIKTTGDVYAHVTKEIEEKTARIFGDFIRKNS
jgi:integrase